MPIFLSILPFRSTAPSWSNTCYADISCISSFHSILQSISIAIHFYWRSSVLCCHKKKHNTLVNTCVFISIGNSFNCHPFIYFILLPFMLPFLYIAIHLCCHSFLSPLQFYCDSFAVQFISIVIHYVLPFIQLPFALAFIYIPSHLCCHFHSHCHSFPLPSIYINLPFMCPLCVNFYWHFIHIAIPFHCHSILC